MVGAGSVAQRRLPRLLRAGADVDVIAPEATPAVEGMAAAGEIRWHRRRYADGDLRHAWYAIACTDDTRVNEAVSAEAERERVFCVRADAGPDGSAVTPATGEFDGLPLLRVSRPESSAPSVGSHNRHVEELATLMQQAFS